MIYLVNLLELRNLSLALERLSKVWMLIGEDTNTFNVLDNYKNDRYVRGAYSRYLNERSEARLSRPILYKLKRVYNKNNLMLLQLGSLSIFFLLLPDALNGLSWCTSSSWK